jgi:hypothetical protein
MKETQFWQRMSQEMESNKDIIFFDMTGSIGQADLVQMFELSKNREFQYLSNMSDRFTITDDKGNEAVFVSDLVFNPLYEMSSDSIKSIINNKIINDFIDTIPTDNLTFHKLHKLYSESDSFIPEVSEILRLISNNHLYKGAETNPLQDIKLTLAVQPFPKIFLQNSYFFINAILKSIKDKDVVIFVNDKTPEMAELLEGFEVVEMTERDLNNNQLTSLDGLLNLTTVSGYLNLKTIELDTTVFDETIVDMN